MLSGDKYQPFLAFSVYTNGKKLFSCKKSNSSDQIDCLHGIRSIATMWIALAHMFSFFVWLPIRNRSTMNEVFYSIKFSSVSIILIAKPFIFELQFLASYRSMIWVSALIVVDTWLVLSGILASMSMLGILKRYVRFQKFSKAIGPTNLKFISLETVYYISGMRN